MHWYHGVLATMAIMALGLSWHVPRCGKWIFLLTVTFVVSVVYHRFVPYNNTLPHGAVVAFICDAVLYIIIRQMHVERWEFWGLGSIAILMATLNLVQVFAVTIGFPPVLPQPVYSMILEVANAAFLSIIGGVGLMDLIRNGKHEGHGMAAHRGNRVAASVSSAVTSARKKSNVTKLSF